MSEQLNQLDSDYRNFNESELPIPFSNRILTPNLEIEEHDGKYIARLGARIKCGKSIIFYPCPSLSHNWLIHNNRIKPLPYDTPALLSKALSAIDPDDLKFSTVLSLYRDGLENIEVHISNSIFAKANTRAKNMVLDTSVPKLHARLYPYQEQGIAWMNNTLNSIEGLILADEMGLGKTLQIISLFLLNEPTNDSPALIVCPTSLIANWRREIHKFSPTLTIQIHRGPDRTGYYKDLMRSQIVITTYDTLVNGVFQDSCRLFRS
jgi:SNF2 family DNA or RNA helicase